MRPTSLKRSIALGLSASLAFGAHDAIASAIAFAAASSGGTFSFQRFDFIHPPHNVGALTLFVETGAFAGADFSSEYVIVYPSSDLYSIDVANATATSIGTVSTPGYNPHGMHWDAASGQMFLIAPDASCTTSALYTVDTTDASTVEVGSTPGCIVALAIDANGNAFGVDVATESLVSIDLSTGAAAEIGALDFDPEFAVGGLDFDPDNGSLFVFAYDADVGVGGGLYVVDTTQGTATLAASTDISLSGFAFAEDADGLLEDGFDPYF